MSGKYIILTTINYPTQAVKTIAKMKRDWTILAVADSKTPTDFKCRDVRMLSIEEQKVFESNFAQECPFNHYARKNIGYLKVIRDGAKVIVDTDDDNIPKDNFLDSINQSVTGRLVKKPGWENIYRHFTNEKIWPRGFTLEHINQSFETISPLADESVFDCPVQQHLVDGDPDVDAVYRLTTKGNMKFHQNTIVLGEGTFCPFNSQNTIWWPDAFVLLYLPCTVSFRMTDIWRSFIAQICLYRAGKNIAFGQATMFQDRNEHNLLKDFADEIPGYLNNSKIMELLSDIRLSDNPHQIGPNMRTCYERLVEEQIVSEDELHLVDLWLKDIKEFSKKTELVTAENLIQKANWSLKTVLKS